jgi:hypothetical protein
MTPSGNLRAAPYVMAAFLCERVLQEADSVLSFIRVVDRFIRPRPSAQIPMQPIQVSVVIGMKTGDVPTASYRVRVRAYKEDDDATALFEFENNVFFQGIADAGVNIVTPLIFVPDSDGLYWVDVTFMDDVITRIPFRVIFADAQLMPTPPRAGA